MSQAELRAEFWRRGAGIRGFVGAPEIWRLVEWLGDLVAVRHSRHARAATSDRGPDGQILVTLPAAVGDEEGALLLLHEVAHGLLEMPAASFSLPRPPRGVSRVRGLARLAAVTELEVDVLTDAVRLPRQLLGRYLELDEPDLAGLMDDSGCDQATVARRLAWLARCPTLYTRHPPPWSAWGHYAVTERAQRRGGAIVLRADTGELLEYPYARRAERDGIIRDLHWSLAALRPHEVLLQRRQDRAQELAAGLLWHELTGEPA